MMSLAVPFCGAVVELAVFSTGQPGPLLTETLLQLTLTPHTDSGGTCMKQEASWALSSLPGLVHTHWSRAEPGLWGLSKAALAVCHLVELLCVLSHTVPFCRDGGGLRRCPGFGWDRVNFLSSWYSAVFWI